MTTAPLLVLAVDQRPWLTKALYGHTGPATPSQRAAICRGKHVVLDGLLQAVTDGKVDPSSAAVLVDQELGPGVAERARAHGVTVSMPLERAGQDLYEDEPADVAAYLAHHEPDLAKVLVRYNPDGDPEGNAVQRARLAATAAVVADSDSRFLFELLVPPTAGQLKTAGGADAFDHDQRPALILRAMTELAEAMHVDVWKLEHLGSQEGYGRASRLAQETGGECILLGAGAPSEQVAGWLTSAAREGFTGFAIGRSVWWDFLRQLLAGDIDDRTAARRIADVYLRFAETFLAARSPVAAGDLGRG